MQPLIIIGSRHDTTAQYVAREATRRSITFIPLDLDEFLENGAIDEQQSQTAIHLGELSVFLEPETGIYARLADYLQSTLGQEERQRRSQKLYELQKALHFADSLVVPYPLADGGNGSKVGQLQLLQKAGFSVPASLATTDPEQAREFIKRYFGRVIYKSVSGERSIVRRVTADKLCNLSRLSVCPVLFQEEIEGFDVRLHVIDGQGFAERIDAGEVDYRYAKSSCRTFQQWKVPEEILSLATQFMKSVNLDFVGFDFKVCKKTGAYYCLEANPCPGFNGYDERAGKQISATLFEFLLQEPLKRHRPSSDAAFLPANAPKRMRLVGSEWAA